MFISCFSVCLPSSTNISENIGEIVVGEDRAQGFKRGPTDPVSIYSSTNEQKQDEMMDKLEARA